MVHRSKRYKTANNFIRNNIDNVDTIVSHSLGSATTMKLNQDYNTGFTTRTYGTPTVSFNDNTDSKNTRFRAVGDPVSMFDRGVDKNSPIRTVKTLCIITAFTPSIGDWESQKRMWQNQSTR